MDENCNMIKVEDYGKKHLSDFFEDGPKLVQDNDYIRGCYAIGDIVGNACNSLYEITEAMEFVLRPELRDILKTVYTDYFISKLEDFVKVSKQL